MTKDSAPMRADAVVAYLKAVAQIRRSGETGELAYRHALQTLLHDVCAQERGLEVVHEPEGQKCGHPDFAVKKSGVAVGYVETKRIGADLNAEERGKQVTRYRDALSNFVLTDYLEFRRYADGDAGPVAVARIADSNLRKIPNGVDDLARLLNGFADDAAVRRGESVSVSALAKIMAGKTRLLRDIVTEAAADSDSALAGIHRGLRANLIRDLKLPDFADIFAQTAAYGFFAARLESEKRGAAKFSRVQAGHLLPQTTVFLRNFFNAFAGADIDERISWMTDDIAAMFSAVSLDSVVGAFNRGGQADDPFLHFYETFLKEYDPKNRQARGVYFTPAPVVDFIVRAVDHSLVNDFGIRDGLAHEKHARIDGRAMHKVQILDPAAGTGAFLARVTELVRERVEEKTGPGGWKDYVPEHLLPRLHGFEILMSAYAMCHLKMALTLGDNIGGLFSKARKKTDYRVNVFLTSALDVPEAATGELDFLKWLHDEARAANRVKKETPVMVVLGNPPYNVSSQNRGEWIAEKLKDYTEGLVEAHFNLNDDYIKFIRYAEHFIEKNGRGVIAMITNNSFLDGITHRQMRRHLLGTFDTIRILNLHGNATIRERAPDDNGADQNVFNIRQGVGIFIMAKTGKKGKGKDARVFHAKLQGKRKMKYDFLARESVDGVKWGALRPVAPNYFFTPKDFSAGAEREYMRGVGVKELFQQNRSGSKTDRDSLFIDMDEKPLAERMRTLLGGNYGEEFAARHKVENSSGYNMLERIRRGQKAGFRPEFVLPILYRPFDTRLVYFDPELLSRPNNDTMRHMKGGQNVALLTTRLLPANRDFTHAHISRQIAGAGAVGGWTYVFPLWVWEKEMGDVRRANFREEVAEKFAKRMGMDYAEEGSGSGVVSAAELFDYIYAVLHRPSYRSRFAEFLRIGFPRIPAAADKREFRRLSKLGGELRELHLLESPFLDDAGHPFSADGENKVENVRFSPDRSSRAGRGRVFINAKRHFADVPQAAWEYCVGGYYPAQKWLKDRKGRSLSFDDQRHYRRLLAALARTAELVGRLDRK